MEINGCPLRLMKQRRIDDLKGNAESLQGKLRSGARSKKGSSTPSSERTANPNMDDKQRNPTGQIWGGGIMTEKEPERPCVTEHTPIFSCVL